MGSFFADWHVVFDAVWVGSFPLRRMNLLKTRFATGDFASRTNSLVILEMKVAFLSFFLPCSSNTQCSEPFFLIAIDLCCGLLVVKPDDRLTADEAVNHVWFSTYSPLNI